MQYGVLGPLEVRTEAGEALAVRRGRPRALLHLLLMHRRVVVPVEVVADRLWEGELPRDAANGVHQLVSYLRRALGPDGKHELATSPVGYRLDAADDGVDAWQFDTLLRQAGSGLEEGSADGAQRAIAAAERAARLWRGDPYPESSGYEWSTGDINRLKEGYLQLQAARLESALALGRHREVVLEAQSLAAAYPLHEQFHAQHALALYRSDRQSEALEVLRGVRQVLADELGLDPGAQLQLLERRILHHDRELEWHPLRDSIEVPPSPAPSPPTPPPASERAAPAAFPTTSPPPRPPRLHGRDTDVTQLVELLAAGALVTLTGPAGIGKSALARAAARMERHARLWYVDLSDVEEPGLAATAVARQTGFPGQLPADPTSVVVSGFRGAAGLLVLDACEQLLPDLATLVTAVRAASPELTVLATSRRPLGLDDETVYRLAPLTVPDGERRLSAPEVADLPSVKLFMERATRVRKDFGLDSSTASDIAEIVRAMEGLPLGIELAAANADALDAKGIRDRLHELLTAAAETSAPSHPRRQTSLTAALDSSCALLTHVEKRVLGPLSVFRGAFDLDAVVAVVDPDVGDPYPVLASLVRQSMVSYEGSETYRLLRPMREYAAEKVAAGADHDEIRRRHAAYVRAASERASRELRTTTTALSRLHRLLPDARAAMEWSLATDDLGNAADIGVAFAWYWTINGLADEGLQWLSAVSERADRAPGTGALDARRTAAVLRNLGLLSNPTGAVREAASFCRRSLMLSRAVGDDVGTTAALLTLGIAEWALGDFAAAAAAHDEAYEIATGSGERWHLLAALTLRARTALDAAEADALDRIEAAIAAGHADGDRQMLSIAMALLSRHHLADGQLDAAALAAEHAVRQARQIHYLEGELGALNLLGRARLAQGRLDDAGDCFARALQGAVDIAHRGAVCESLESMAMTAAAAGRHERAYLLLYAAARERHRLGVPVPASSAAAVTEVAASTAEVLGPSTSLVEAQVKLMRFDELVDELLSVHTADTASHAPATPRAADTVRAATEHHRPPVAATTRR